MQLMRVVTWLITKFEKANIWFISVAALCLFSMMLIDTLNIIGIKFGYEVIPAGKSFIEESMAVIVFIGMAYVLMERGHIKTDVFKSRFSSPLCFASDILSYVIIICVSGFVFWRNMVAAVLSFQQHATLPAKILIPIGPFILIIALSFLDVALCALLLLIRECLRRIASQKDSENIQPSS